MRRLGNHVVHMALLLTLVGQTALAGVPVLDQESRARLDPRLARAWDEGDPEFRVIVHLLPPHEARIPLGPRGVEFPAARLDAVEEVVTRRLGEILKEVGPGELRVGHTYRLQPAFSARVDRTALAAIAGRPGVDWVELDEVWQAFTAEGLPMIHADVLHARGIDGSGTSVAIVDTGIDPEHPTLGGGPIPNGKVIYGKDTADNDDDPTDCGSHGTAVASIAAGLAHSWDTGFSFAGGVAPGAGILAYKASPTGECGSFYTSDVSAAIEDATLLRDTYNVVALNLSIGSAGGFDGPCDSRNFLYASAINDAVAAGIAVFAASGNSALKDAIATPACLANSISVGSVYDSDIQNTYRYCANDSCTEILCTDAFPKAGTVTCYSNSSLQLDILAPSEDLTAARPHGTTQGFGGTSGAAPYATGAAALLAQSNPNLTPEEIRMLLGLTGQPVTDADNGITRSLIDVEAAADPVTVGVGSPGNAAIPNATGLPLVSTTTIASAGTVESMTVSLKVAHGNPEQLLVTLVSPSGTRVKLEDHPTPGGDGIYAVYPLDRQPVESLDAFTGEPAAGTWTLEILDDDPDENRLKPSILVAWGLKIDTGGTTQPPEFTSYSIPVAAHVKGAPGTFWVTDARIFNPSPTQSAAFTLYLIPQGEDGTQVWYQSPVTVPPLAIQSLPDLVLTAFGQTTAGHLLVQSDGAQLLMTSRTYNTGGEEGTYGQFVGMDRGIDGVGAGDGSLHMLQLASNAGFRTNIGFSEVAGKTARVRVTLFDGETGLPVGVPGEYTVEPFSNAQVNTVFEALGADTVDNGRARVEVIGGEGRVAMYASVVDRTSGDAIYVPAVRPVEAASQVVPIVANATGRYGTLWLSDVRIYNAGSSSVELDLEFRPEVETSGTEVTVTRTVGAGRVLALNDIVGTVLDQPGAYGSLRIATTSGAPASLLITSRTYNSGGESGTYGQFVPAVSTGFGAGRSTTILHLDSSAAFRSNVGICEVSGGTVTVRYVLKDADGQTLGTGTQELGPWQVRQINDIFLDVGASPRENTRLDLFLNAGTGTFTAYGSLVDATTGDAITIPVMEY